MHTYETKRKHSACLDAQVGQKQERLVSDPTLIFELADRALYNLPGSWILSVALGACFAASQLVFWRLEYCWAGFDVSMTSEVLFICRRKKRLVGDVINYRDGVKTPPMAGFEMFVVDATV